MKKNEEEREKKRRKKKKRSRLGSFAQTSLWRPNINKRVRRLGVLESVIRRSYDEEDRAIRFDPSATLFPGHPGQLDHTMVQNRKKYSKNVI